VLRRIEHLAPGAVGHLKLTVLDPAGGKVNWREGINQQLTGGHNSRLFQFHTHQFDLPNGSSPVLHAAEFPFEIVDGRLIPPDASAVKPTPKGSAAWSRRSFYKRLLPLFAHGVRHRWLAENLMFMLRAPDVPSDAKGIYTGKQFNALLAETSVSPDKLPFAVYRADGFLLG
jgi:hypothetical protein